MFKLRTHNFKIYCSFLLYLPRCIWNLQRCLCPRRKRDDGNGSVWRTDMLLYITLLVENRFKFQRNACCNLLLSFIYFCLSVFDVNVSFVANIMCIHTALSKVYSSSKIFAVAFSILLLFITTAKE